MPRTDEVCIKPDIERSFVLKKHLNFYNICVRILSHVALPRLFSKLSRDYLDYYLDEV